MRKVSLNLTKVNNSPEIIKILVEQQLEIAIQLLNVDLKHQIKLKYLREVSEVHR